MSDAADLSRVLALSHKGFELGHKGHNARAAEKFSRAAAEAEKALPDPDCLVTCALRLQSSMRWRATQQGLQQSLLMRMRRCERPACSCCRL
jgi:hypothetical protein